MCRCLRRIFAAAGVLVAAATLTGCRDRGPVFSSDGSSLAYVTDKGLRIAEVEGGGSRLLTGTKDADQPTWSPDGRYLTVELPYRKDQTPYLLDLSTGKRARLPVDKVAAWRPDGRQLVGEREVDGVEELAWVDIPSGQVTETAPLPEDVSPDTLVSQPRCLSDGRLAFVAAEKGRSDASPSNLDHAANGEVTRLTTSGDVYGLTAPPSEDQLIWLRGIPGSEPTTLRLFARDMGTGAISRLPITPDHAVTAPPHGHRLGLLVGLPSPDARHMLLLTYMVENRLPKHKQRGVFSLWLARLDGTGARLVRRLPRSVNGPAPFPAWSPDSRRFALMDHRGKRETVEVVDADTLRARRIPSLWAGTEK
jgi:hypothetical protein